MSSSTVQQFLLKWNNHQPNFISVFKSFLLNKSLVDVTLSTEGKQIYAHKVVLSACSVYFQELFAENPSNHPIVILKDVKYSDLEVLVDFIYCGQVNVSEEQLPQLLETAKTLKIKGLIEMPEASLTRAQAAAESTAREAEAEAAAQNPSPSAHTPPASTPHRVIRRRRSSNIQNHNSNATGEHGEEGMAMNAASAASDQIDHGNTEEQGNNHLMMETLNQGDWSMCSNAFGNGEGMQEGVAGGSSGYMSGCGQQSGANYMSCGVNGSASTSVGCMMGCDAENPYGAQMQHKNQMPLTPPRRRRRSVNPQADQKFIAALEAVRFGGIGFCKAARLFGVNNRTLWLEYKRRGYPNTRSSIRNRIKRENPTPNPLVKQEVPIAEHLMTIHEGQDMTPVCQTNNLPLGYMNARNANFTLHSMMQNNQPLNLHGINFNPNPMQ